ncbi:MAG TPA: winged helix DNA-binding domain-containing protein [Candidatus Limnocylindrales bacterium]|nr:winged helix DNA-binding domain-containing protein [Candidatus Limnocylindrales bacterium]
MPPVEAVRRVVALQAQEPASPYLALWARLAGFEAAAMDDAFATRRLVKASLMRITLHAVHEDDYPAFHAAMATTLRRARLGDPRFTVSGLSPADADALLPDLVAFATEPRSKAELHGHLDERTGGVAEPTWWAFRTFAPLHHHSTGAPWSFGRQPAFVAAHTGAHDGTDDEAARHLARRYLEGFGPASAKDLNQFAMLGVPVARAAMEALGEDLVRFEGPDGGTLYDLRGAPLPDEAVSAPPRLLPMWDSTLLAYADRSRLIPEAYRRRVIRSNGDTLPTLLVDGLVAGVWRPVEGGIEASAFHPLPGDAWAGLEAEARSLIAFLAPREPAVYGRYRRWWPAEGAAEVRVLPG